MYAYILLYTLYALLTENCQQQYKFSVTISELEFMVYKQSFTGFYRDTSLI